jgi:hypothetical protein
LVKLIICIVESYTERYGRNADKLSISSDYDFQCIYSTVSLFALLNFQITDYLSADDGFLRAYKGWENKSGEEKYNEMRHFASTKGWESELERFDSWLAGK